MIRWCLLVLPLLLIGCAHVDWDAAGREWARAACNGSEHCAVTCPGGGVADPRDGGRCPAH